ncbi:MAG: pyrimidine/purine nucleoside phosphorylase [Spirochaetales bacterium]|nr:pyrimidine/purine nucleoside phosphorylase [Spirochaetales bacterium]
MISVNEYFNGNVKSLGLTAEGGKATIGVMAAGEYEFGTSTIEIMRIVSGRLEVLLPGETQWREYGPDTEFTVAAGVKFSVRAKADTSYLCLYR